MVTQAVDTDGSAARQRQEAQVRLPGKNTAVAFLRRAEAVLGVAWIDGEHGSVSQSRPEDPVGWRLVGRSDVKGTKAYRTRSCRVDSHFFNLDSQFLGG